MTGGPDADAAAERASDGLDRQDVGIMLDKLGASASEASSGTLKITGEVSFNPSAGASTGTTIHTGQNQVVISIYIYATG